MGSNGHRNAAQGHAWRPARVGALAAAWSAAWVSVLSCTPEPRVIDYTASRVIPATLRELPERVPAVAVVPEGVAALSGQVKSWLSLRPVDGATLQSYGMQPPAETVTDESGAFTVDVQAAGIFWAYASKEGYLPTYDLVRMPAGDHRQTLYALSAADLERAAQVYGVVLNPRCATVIGEVRSPANSGQPGLSEVTLIGASHQGPYFLDDLGQPVAGLEATSSSGRVLFFNVCDLGSDELTDGADLQIASLDGGYLTRPSLLKAFAGRVTRGVVQVLATPEEGGTPPPPAPPAPDAPNPYLPDPVEAPVEDLVLVDFTTEIYPIFAANGCAACHVAGSVAEETGLYFDGTPEVVYGLLREGDARVNLAYPAESTVLTKPLLEEPPNHPNASFESVYTADYQKLLAWIEQGAPYGAAPPPPPVEPVYFDTDVYGLLQAYDSVSYPYGRGCANCHNVADLSGDLDLTGGAAVVFQRLVDKNLYDVNYPERSRLLRLPYCGPTKCADDPDRPVVHATEVFATTEDPGYQTLYQWVAQGAAYSANPEPPPPELPQGVSFATDVQPRFARRGCTGCHDAVRQEGGLNLTGTADAVIQRLMNPDVQRVVPGDYAASALYGKPLATAPDVVHGGGKPIPNEDDDFARYVAGWIQEGAPFLAPEPQQFADDIVPLFGLDALGCTACHSDALNSGGLSLEGSPATVHRALVEGGRVSLDDPLASTLVTMAFDLYPEVVHSGGKVAVQQQYRAYHQIVTWIFEGAEP